MSDELLRYFPPRLVQALLLLVTLTLLFGTDRVAGWLEALGWEMAMRVVNGGAG